MLEPPALRRDSRVSLDLFSPAARLVDAQPILRGAADPCDTPDTPLSAHVATHGPIPMPLLRAAPVPGLGVSTTHKMACSPVARVAPHTIAANNLKQHLCPTLLNSPSHASLGHAPAMLLWHWPRCTPAGTAHACMPVAVACGVQRAGRGRQCYTTTAIPLHAPTPVEGSRRACTAAVRLLMH